MFDLTLDYVQDDRARERNDALERIVRASPQLNARYLEKMQRVQEVLVTRVTVRLAAQGAAPDGPRPAAIVGAAFACMQAARTAWLESNQEQPFSDYLDEAMSTFRLT